MTDKPEREITHERAALRGDVRAKTCPFCGEMPEVELGLTARIACIEVDCLNPIVHSPTLADALAFWNMRRASGPAVSLTGEHGSRRATSSRAKIGRWLSIVAGRNLRHAETGDDHPMTKTLVEFIGGPAHGARMTRPRVATVNVPTPSFGRFAYTIRRCRDEDGNLVEILAPAGREVDPAFLAKRGLRN